MQSPSFCKRADALQVCTGDDTCGVACQVSPLTSPFFFFSFSPHFSGKFGFLKKKMLMHIIINLLHSTSISFYKYKKSLRKKKGSMATLSVHHLHTAVVDMAVSRHAVCRGAHQLFLKVGHCKN
jgi:hypothetical protein